MTYPKALGAAAAVAAVTVLAVTPAGAHRSGCHAAHSCPSDHHSYTWTSPTGGRYNCAEPGAPEYNPSRDTTTIRYAGRTYRCYRAGSTRPQVRCRAHSGLPDRHCTPGQATRATRRQVCRAGYASSHRHVTERAKRRVYAAYGVRHHRPGAYEIDHLVSLELGGRNTIRNLWPQHETGRRGARAKDRLENRLHTLVCRRRLGLRSAQRQEQHNWKAAYSRYVG